MIKFKIPLLCSIQKTGAVRAVNGGRKQTTLLGYNRATDNTRSTGLHRLKEYRLWSRNTSTIQLVKTTGAPKEQHIQMVVLN